jgi:hypothetical protein
MRGLFFNSTKKGSNRPDNGHVKNVIVLYSSLFKKNTHSLPAAGDALTGKL